MKAAEALIAWNPDTADEIMVGPLLREGDRDWTDPYDYTGGAACVFWRNLSGWHAVGMLFIDFHTITVRDGLDPQAVHREFLKIDEYRDRISPDIPGATPGDPFGNLMAWANDNRAR